MKTRIEVRSAEDPSKLLGTIEMNDPTVRTLTLPFRMNCESRFGALELPLADLVTPQGDRRVVLADRTAVKYVRQIGNFQEPTG